MSSHIPHISQFCVLAASSKSDTMTYRLIFVFLCIFVICYRHTEAYCSQSNKGFGSTLKCWNTTLREIARSGGPIVAVISIANSRIDNIPAYSFSSYTKSLQSLALSNCGVSQMNVNAFAGLTFLKKLNLANNKITAVQPEWFTNLISLEELDLSFNGIEAINASVFAKLANLRLLTLNNNQLKCIEPRDMEPMRSVAKIYITENPLSLLCRARMTQWFGDKGIKYLHDLDSKSGSWLDRVLWLCAEDDYVAVKTETQMRECVLLNIFNQLKLALKTTDSYYISAQQCLPERQRFSVCLKNSGRGPDSLTNGKMVMNMVLALRDARRQLQKSNRLPLDD